MKTLEQFLSELNGNFCEVAGSANAKNQCVDLANAYLRDVCNHSIVEWTNACDFPYKIKDMEWIVNDEITDLPKEGDIIIWNKNVGGGAGHIAIFLEGTTSKFNSFDQNWPLYSPCHVQSHTYTNVDGWLRPKSVIIDNMTDIVSELIKTNGITEGDIRWLIDLKANQTVSNLEKQVNDLNEKIHEYEIEVQTLLAEITQYQKEIKDWQSKEFTANSTIEELNQTISNLNTDVTTWKTRYENKCKETVDKYSTLELFKFAIKSLFKK